MLNITIEWTGIILSVLGILQSVIGTRIDRYLSRYFVSFFSMLILFALSHILVQYMYSIGHTDYILFAITIFINLCMPSALAYVASKHLMAVIDPAKEVRIVRWVLEGLLILNIILVGILQTLGFFNWQDVKNLYYHRSWYPVTYITIATTIIIDICLLIIFRKRLTKREKAAFWFYVTIPTAAIVVQIIIDGVPVLIPTLVITALLMYIFLLADRRERNLLQYEQNEKMRVDLLLSQIQPHFLYNSLLVIGQICLNDGEKASAAICDFAQYLRHNIDVLTTDVPIPFKRELEHVNQYIKLQQLRFPNEINVVYDIDVDEFCLPALIFQPLVENAIRYGIRKTESGEGTVTIRTRETEKFFEISVIDDGPGFSPESEKSADKQEGLGIKNVRERLKITCGGSLLIKSAPGKGTEATILLGSVKLI